MTETAATANDNAFDCHETVIEPNGGWLTVEWREPWHYRDLLIDEVLAVGDIAFQRKCLGKMHGVSKSGRTVLFVSHNMNAVETLCPRSIFIDHGRCDGIGPSSKKIAEYVRSNETGDEIGVFSSERLRSDGTVEFVACRIRNQRGDEGVYPKTNEHFTLHLHVRAHELIRYPAINVEIRNHLSTLMTNVSTTEQGIQLPPFERGDHDVAIRVGPIAYLPVRYTISLNIANPQGHIYAVADDAIRFEVAQSPLYGARDLDSRWGCVYTPIAYEISPMCKQDAESPANLAER